MNLPRDGETARQLQDRGEASRYHHFTSKAPELTSRGFPAARARPGASGADIDPMAVDAKIGFGDVGGLGHHVRSLKEMIVFPLLYPEYFKRYSVDPPRGVLFYGSPGTGKTLCARALANVCSRAGRHVAFYMRKGADCLSKWVGESERMLRMLRIRRHTSAYLSMLYLACTSALQQALTRVWYRAHAPGIRCVCDADTTYARLSHTHAHAHASS